MAMARGGDVGGECAPSHAEHEEKSAIIWIILLAKMYFLWLTLESICITYLTHFEIYFEEVHN